MAMGFGVLKSYKIVSHSFKYGLTLTRFLRLIKERKDENCSSFPLALKKIKFSLLLFLFSLSNRIKNLHYPSYFLAKISQKTHFLNLVSPSSSSFE